MKVALMVFIHPDDEVVSAGTHSRGYWYKLGMLQGAFGLFLLEALIFLCAVVIAMVL